MITLFYRYIFFILFFTLSLEASAEYYKQKAKTLNLSESRDWAILLHMQDGVSQIDDDNFFFAKNGKTDAKSELDATIEAFLNETDFGDSSAACRFPARKVWIKEKLGDIKFPDVTCGEYEKVLQRLNPKSATLVFSSAHINSPASMFGHTFLRINSTYESKLLSYALNYAADADEKKENGLTFAFKGLFGGYFGKYSLLPYYDKLKEYRDLEQRDIWEYDLDLNEEETLRMVRHMWELNEIRSSYYFFTQNCSYNMLWFIEAAKKDLDLRKYFSFQVIPLETLHAAKSEDLIKEEFYRPSKRTKILKYEELLFEQNREIVLKLLEAKVDVSSVLQDKTVDIEQKRYIFEAAIELLEYNFSKKKIEKEPYLKLFQEFSKARATLAKGTPIDIKTPPNPLYGHQALRISLGGGVRDKRSIGLLGVRPAYHSLEDSNYGFLRGTQIEFLNLDLSYTDNKLSLEEATILSIASFAEQSYFFDNLSWRTKFGWDRYSLDTDAVFMSSVGAGFSYGGRFGYTYLMADPLFYFNGVSAIGSSLGFVFDRYNYMNIKAELTRRWYDSGSVQNIFELSQGFRFSKNIQIRFGYEMKESLKSREEDFKCYYNYYF